MRSTTAIAAALTAFAMIDGSVVRAAGTGSCLNIEKEFSVDRIRDNDSLRLIAFAHLRTAGYDRRNKAIVLGGHFPAGDVVANAAGLTDLSPKDYESLQSALKGQIDLRKINAARFNDIAIAGDPQAREIWRDCRVPKPEPFAWFEWDADRSTADLYVERGATNANSAPYFKLSPVTLAAGFNGTEDWLRRGKKDRTKRSSATITAVDRHAPLSVRIGTNDGEASAYLPPRITIDIVPSEEGHGPHAKSVNGRQDWKGESKDYVMDPSLAKEGFRYWPSGVAILASSLGQHMTCKHEIAKVSATSFKVKFRYENASNSRAACNWQVAAKMYKIEIGDGR